ncbi:factor 1-like [Mactra antiquata]
MAQYRIHDPEELLECPYDKTHMVRAKRFQYHLMNCRKNYVKNDYEKCPFNAKHHIPKPEFRHHLANCPDKAIVEPELSYANRKENGIKIELKGCTDTPVYKDLEIETEEDWDAEVCDNPVRVGPAFDPSYHDRVRFKDLSGMSKTQKAVMNDNRLSAREKMQELGGEQGARGDSLRLPNTPSNAAMAAPKPQPIKQPAHHSVYAFSIGRGSGQNVMANGGGPAGVSNGTEVFSPVIPTGRGRGLRQSAAAVGRGMPAPGLGRGVVAPPPGFCVPNVNNPSQSDYGVGTVGMENFN